MGKGKAGYHIKGNYRQTSSAARNPFSDLNNFNGRTSEMRFLQQQDQQGIAEVLDPSIISDAICAREIDKYVRVSLEGEYTWTSKPEIPSSAEIAFDEEEDDDDDDENAVTIPCNKLVDPWVSREEYLEAQYRLLREDAVSPLRDVVSEMKEEPYIEEKHSQENAAIYERVYILGFVFATKGIAARIQFSLRRVGKQVLWKQSRRLLQGSLVALTPASDMFKTICRVGVIAARPLSAVQQEPPEVDIFFARPDEIEIDPHQEWVMVESRIGYFESARWTLQALQRLSHEKFPLVEHFVNVQTQVQPPKYVLSSPKKNLSNVFENTDAKQEATQYSDIDVLKEWPFHAPSALDASQLSALHRVLSKRLAIVQGPPGTGKTHVSVVALKTLQVNMTTNEPPIIVSAHTNHALDQILRHIAVFEPDFIRLGGMTLDEEVIKPRTLLEVRKAVKLENFRPPVSFLKAKNLIRQMCELLKPLTAGEEPLPGALFAGFGIITANQCDSLTRGAQEWHCVNNAGLPSGDMAMWLSPKNLEPAKRTFKPVDFGVQIEEADLDVEEIQEIEAEQKASAEDEIEALKGPRVVFKEPWTGRVVKILNETKIQEYLKEEDLWNIPDIYRGTVYKYLRNEYIHKVTAKFRGLAAQYAEAVRDIKISRWQTDARYLSQARIIGCTTTGLSKYRALLHGLRPKIVMIEEAAETLEAYVTAACFDSLEHLILVGDHQQLRPSCSVKELEGHPFNLAVSLFERLVCNNVEFSQLLKQRRMRPEMRQALAPIYSNLIDHPCVFNREAIPGMGGVNSYFFSHVWHEDSDDHQSKVNIEEAKMIVAFFNYLVENGMKIKDITILTFYNGQRKFIVHLLRKHSSLQGETFNVRTVDSYQGEENGVVILSLARSNRSRNIGFLSIVNRVCVAMSRAQRGFYIFGNAKMLSHASKIWWQIVQIMAKKPRRVGYHLPLTCQNHGKRTYVDRHEDFEGSNGGCSQRCFEELPCGHVCQLSCHPMNHDLVNCHAPCNKQLECGHSCREYCYIPCQCTCDSSRRPTPLSGPLARPQRPQLFTGDTGESVGAYREYATGGHVESDDRLAELIEIEEYLRQLRLEEMEENISRVGARTPSPEGDGLLRIEETDGIYTSKTMTSGGRTRWKHEGLFRTEPVKQRAAEDGSPKKNMSTTKSKTIPLNPKVAPFESKIMEPLEPIREPIREPLVPKVSESSDLSDLSFFSKGSIRKENMKPTTIATGTSKPAAKPLFSDSAFRGLQPTLQSQKARILQPIEEFMSPYEKGYQSSVAEDENDEGEEKDKANASDGEKSVIYRFTDKGPTTTTNVENAISENTDPKTGNIKAKAKAEVDTDAAAEAEARLWDFIEGQKKPQSDHTMTTEDDDDTVEKKKKNNQKKQKQLKGEEARPRAEVIWNEGEGDLLGML